MSEEKTKKRVLFIGNSLFFRHNLAQQFKHVAETLSGDNVYVEGDYSGGSSLRYQLDHGVLSAKLKKDWDFIVLQDYSVLPTVKKAREVYMEPAIEAIAKLKKKARIVMAMPPGMHQGGDRCPFTTGYDDKNGLLPILRAVNASTPNLTTPSEDLSPRVLEEEDEDACFDLPGGPKQWSDGPVASLVKPPCTNSDAYYHTVQSYECMSYSLARGYLAAQDYGADLVAPMGLAWMAAYGSTNIPPACKKLIDQEYTSPMKLDLPFQVGNDRYHHNLHRINDDKSYDRHPNRIGQYLNALVLYKTLFGKNPLGAAYPVETKDLGLTDPPITFADKQALQRIANGVVEQCGSACGVH